MSYKMPKNPVNQFVEIVGELFFKIKEVLSTLLGWFIMLTTFMVTTFGPTFMLIIWVLLALMIDLFFGSWSALKMKSFHLSFALTSTAIKLVMYVTIFYMPLILDKVVPVDISWITVLVTVLLCAAEFFSSLAHMLIIRPTLLGVIFIRKMMVGEISKKLNCKPEEIEDMITKYTKQI